MATPRTGSMKTIDANSQKSTLIIKANGANTFAVNSVCSYGEFTKQGATIKTWKRRFFVLQHDGTLSYYKKNIIDDSPLGKFSVKSIEFQETDECKKPNCLKLIRPDKKKPFYFYADTAEQLAAWKASLKKVGAVEIAKAEVLEDSGKKGKKALTPQMMKLQETPVASWSTSDVMCWLSFLRTEDLSLKIVRMDQIYKDNFAKANMNGTKLLEMVTPQSWEKIGITNQQHMEQLLYNVQSLQKARFFNFNKYRVFEKIERHRQKVKAPHENFEDLDYLVESLSDSDLIVRTYLNPEDIPESDLEKWANIERQATDADDVIVIDENESPDTKAYIKGELKLRVKLVVTEITRNAATKSIRKILSPIISQIPSFANEYGMFHTALIVGPWYLEWNDSSICIPRKMASSMSLLAADIDGIPVKETNIIDISKKLSEVIVDWNVNYLYNNRKQTKSEGEADVDKTSEFIKAGNCQHFVDSVLRKLGLNVEFSGALKNYLQDMKEKGTCEMTFRPDQNFLDTFKDVLEPNKKSWPFKTHLELDTFVATLMKKVPTLINTFPGEYALLKSFDRALWLRHFKKKSDPSYTPMPTTSDPNNINGFVGGCPFKDPRITGSMK